MGLLPLAPEASASASSATSAVEFSRGRNGHYNRINAPQRRPPVSRLSGDTRRRPLPGLHIRSLRIHHAVDQGRSGAAARLPDGEAHRCIQDRRLSPNTQPPTPGIQNGEVASPRGHLDGRGISGAMGLASRPAEAHRSTAFGRCTETRTLLRAAALWLLLSLFALRVLGQLLVVAGLAPFLPPIEEWQSGLLPYPLLLASQIVILGVLATVCMQFSRRSGYFVRHTAWLATPSGLSAGSTRPEWSCATALLRRDAIPVVFHIVLAKFLLVLAHHHRRARSG